MVLLGSGWVGGAGGLPLFEQEKVKTDAKNSIGKSTFFIFVSFKFLINGFVWTII